MNVRPCKTKVCWYGATNNSLVDVRLKVELWQLDSEIVRWNKIRKAEREREVSELIFAKDWTAQMHMCYLKRIELISSYSNFYCIAMLV